MTRRVLPALALRTTRVRLLAATYEDALLSRSSDAHGTKTARLLLHDDLWTWGSYHELDQALASMNGRRRVFARVYLGVEFKHHPAGVLDELQYVANVMPAFIYVPPEVSENAGYLSSEAGVYEMPASEQRRRWARKPSARLQS